MNRAMAAANRPSPTVPSSLSTLNHWLWACLTTPPPSRKRSWVKTKVPAPVPGVQDAPGADPRSAPAKATAAAAEASLPAPARRRRAAAWPARTVVTVALVLLAASWLVPYLAARAESAALAAAGDGDTAVALSHARRAASLDPLAADPLITEALILQQQGRNGEALAVLQK